MLNTCTLIGNLGADPELAYTANGTPVATLRLATKDVWKDKQGVKQEKTEWHRIVVWGAQGEHCASYLKKGSQACVVGSITTREWEDKEGNRRFTTEIKAQTVKFLSGGSPKNGFEQPQVHAQPQSPQYQTPVVNDPDIPF